MPNMLAISFEGAFAPSILLHCLGKGRKLPDGWGIGYYPGGEPSAAILKEPAPPEASMRSELVRDWEHLEASVLMLHVRDARWGSISDANTQPFVRSWAGRDWVFAHSGSLRHRLELSVRPIFEPVGSTDTEAIFCELMSWVADGRYRSIRDIEAPTLRNWFDFVNEHGSMTSVLSDGRDLVVYADREGDQPVYVKRLAPPYQSVVLGDDDVDVDLTKRGAKARKGVVVSTTPLRLNGKDDPTWERVPNGHLLVLREGDVIREAVPQPIHGGEPTEGAAPRVFVARKVQQASDIAPIRTYDVLHRTVYRYEKPIEKSAHLFRLTPCHDRLQRVVSHEIAVSVEGLSRDYDDVFGNRVRRLVLDRPWTEMVVEARSVVQALDVDPLGFRPLLTHSTIPLIWMPWQRQVLQPFLLPPELPESELRELVEYSMSFVKRNNNDLLDTLLDMNGTIFREYQYIQGVTTLTTTPFDVYCNRRGVCQDFANLFICLARLLGVPARYVCGYIDTGPKNPNKVQSEASHAWVQVYLPEVGWKGFDPTNGMLTQTDHVRVATGRNYVDATPTSGTIYVGGGKETLEVDVRVEPIEGTA